MLGDSNVGKTALREKYLGPGFQSKYMMTIGADFALKEAKIDGRSIKFQIWDIAGQQRFNAVRSVYYLSALGAIIVFDVTKRQSFENCNKWIKEFWTNNAQKQILPVILLANNADLRDSTPDSVSIDEIQQYCKKLNERTQQYGFKVLYFDTNAKTGINISKAFDTLGRLYFDYLEKQRNID